jgi:nitrate/nitrite transport system permease protein
VQLAYSIWRVLLGFGLAALVRDPHRLSDRHVASRLPRAHPYIQILKPTLAVAWMPLALSRSRIE